MTIQVTSEDIRNGQPGHVTADPLALAMKRAGLRNPAVCVGFGYFTANRRRMKFTMSQQANRFRAAFDAGRPVKPFALKVA